MTGRPRPRRQSAGVLLYRFAPGGAPAGDGRVLQVLLGHMGGPMWQRRDVGAWSIPKGGYTDDEDAFAAALREFEEEVGRPVPAERFVDLGEVQQASGKFVRAWAAEGDLDPATAVSNTFEVEWPPGSGRLQPFPEFDRVAWFGPEEAMTKIVTAQAAFVERLLAALASAPAP